MSAYGMRQIVAPIGTSEYITFTIIMIRIAGAPISVCDSKAPSQLKQAMIDTNQIMQLPNLRKVPIAGAMLAGAWTDVCATRH